MKFCFSGDDPRATLPDYVFTEKTTVTEDCESEKTKRNESENAGDVSMKNSSIVVEQNESLVESSTISTRNSLKRRKSSKSNETTSQRSTITRRQVKEKEFVNGHDEVR